MSPIPRLRRQRRHRHAYPGPSTQGDWRRSLLPIAGVVILVIDPAIWLVETWSNSGYDSAGGHFFAVAVGLAIWSWSSRLRDGVYPPPLPWGWLAVAAALVLVGHLLAVSYISAIAIPIGVYALGHIARLGHRRRSVSPAWLAIFVALTLPVEHVVKRLFGYDLQHLAADNACHLLGIVYADVTCTGLDISLRGHELFVDLSCSGARTLLLFAFVFTGLAAVVRPTARQAAIGFGLTLVAGLAVNSLRIALLTAGLVHEPSLGFNVMEHPWHMRVGLACLPLGLLPLAMWARWVHRIPPADRGDRTRRTPQSVDRKGPAVFFAAVAVAVSVSFIPQFPIHIADSADARDLPAYIAGHPERPRTPGRIERRYFERYGGGVDVADYGPHTLVVVTTNAALRHLHTPEQWLGDAGFTVEKIGHTPGLLPADTYRIDGPNGRPRRLDVTYVCDRGRIATSVAEAIWHWRSAPATTWRAYLRFHPLDVSTHQLAAFDVSIIRFFGVPHQPGALPPK